MKKKTLFFWLFLLIIIITAAFFAWLDQKNTTQNKLKPSPIAQKQIDLKTTDEVLNQPTYKTQNLKVQSIDIPVYTTSSLPNPEDVFNQISALLKLSSKYEISQIDNKNTYVFESSDYILSVDTQPLRFQYKKTQITNKTQINQDISSYQKTAENLITASSLIPKESTLLSPDIDFLSATNSGEMLVSNKNNANLIRFKYNVSLYNFPLFVDYPHDADLSIIIDNQNNVIYFFGIVYPAFQKSTSFIKTSGSTEIAKKLDNNEGIIVSAELVNRPKDYAMFNQFTLSSVDVNSAKLYYWYKYDQDEIVPTYFLNGKSTDQTTGNSVTAVIAVYAN